MTKVGIVLEGGAMRGMFTAGVIDVLLDNNISADVLIGASAGVLFGVNFLSKQKGRVIRYSKKYCRDLRYISLFSLFFTGNLVNKNFAYYKISKKLDVFDDETFKNSKSDFYATVTNMETGDPEYIKINSCFEQMEVLRATSAIPLVTKPVIINNKKYLDGAVGDSIPLFELKKMGCDKIIVILTRPINFQKEQLSNKNIKRINKKYKDYPKLIEAMIKRPTNYNNTLNIIYNLEKNKEIFVIRPSKPININVIEHNENNLQRVYDMGISDGEKCISSLIEYLKK